MTYSCKIPTSALNATDNSNTTHTNASISGTPDDRKPANPDGLRTHQKAPVQIVCWGSAGNISHENQFPSLKNPFFANEVTTAGSILTAGLTLSSEVPEAAEVVELERRVFCSVGRATELASVMAEVVTVDASKLA